MIRLKFLSSSWVPRMSRHCTSCNPASIITENWRTNTARLFAPTFLSRLLPFFASALTGEIFVTRISPVKAEAKKGSSLDKKVGAKSLAVFVRQFSVMIDAGLQLVQCLDILGTQEEDKNLSRII